MPLKFGKVSFRFLLYQIFPDIQANMLFSVYICFFCQIICLFFVKRQPAIGRAKPTAYSPAQVYYSPRWIYCQVLKGNFTLDFPYFFSLKKRPRRRQMLAGGV
jgi:hypothetical protein